MYKKLTTSSLFQETSNKVTLNHEAESQSHVEPLGFSTSFGAQRFDLIFILLGYGKGRLQKIIVDGRLLTNCLKMYGMLFATIFFHVKKGQW